MNSMPDDLDTDRSTSPERDEAERKIVLGNINGVFGVKGWVKVFSETEPRQNIVDYRHWWVRPMRRESARRHSPVDHKPGHREPVERKPGRSSKHQAAAHTWRQLEVLDGRRQGKTVVAKIAGIETPEKAQLLIGHEIAVDRSQMPTLKKGEYYWTDLIGHVVENQDGSRLGIVERLFATGANDVLVVRKDGDFQAATDTQKGVDPEILIPWIMGSVILEVNVDAARISVDWDPDY